jgi:biotin carboxyl carrier protein
MNAVAYNRRQQRLGLLSDEKVAKLVFLLQQVAGFDDEDCDGKFGTDSDDALAGMTLKVPNEFVPGVVQVKHDEGPKEKPTPNPDVWKGWVYPMPILDPLGAIVMPDVSSTFAQYGKGPNRSRKNHWGADVMYVRHNDDGGPQERYPEGNRYHGLRRKEAPVYSPRWYCPHGVDCYSAGPGTVYRVRHGSNNSVLIDHHNVPGFGPLATWYQHMHEIFVEKGDEVEAGEVIGTIGAGSTNLIHLHFEFRDFNRGKTRAQAVVNPEPYLDLFEKRS